MTLMVNLIFLYVHWTTFIQAFLFIRDVLFELSFRKVQKVVLILKPG